MSLTTQTPLAIAQAVLLAPAGLTEQHLEAILGSALKPSADETELYFQSIQQETWVLEDTILREGLHHTDHGVGMRVISGEKVGSAHSNDITLSALREIAGAAQYIAQQGSTRSVRLVSSVGSAQGSAPTLYGVDNPLGSLANADKVALLQALDREARRLDPRVTQVVAALSSTHEVILIASSDGTLQADVRPLVRLDISVIVEDKGRRERGSTGSGGRFGYERLLDPAVIAAHAGEAVRQALLNLSALPAPAGVMPVVLGSGWPGVLLHEAIGHGLEGDFNRKGTSAFSGRLGECVASRGCTVVDDGTLFERRGSLRVDDEGTPTQCTTLIEKGVLTGYLHDKINARLMGQAPTGNGRRESYAHLTLPRMTNTYLLPGEHLPEDIIRSVDRGIYAVNFGGGQVDITSGRFVFNTSEAYWIEKGKITHPVKGAMLIGSGPEILKAVSMVGNDLRLDAGVGICGKEGQSVPVGVGQPTVKIDGMTVGGTDAAG